MRLFDGSGVVVVTAVGLLGVVLGCGSQTAPSGGEKSTEWISGTGVADLDGRSLGSDVGALDGGAEATDEEGSRVSAYPPEAFSAHRATLELDEARLADIQQQYTADVAGITFESSPEEVTQAFVRLLHREDLTAAERLLTLAARAIIHESGLGLGPIAGPRAEYRFGVVHYATNARERAFVDCVVHDPELGGEGPEAGSFKVTWALRPESRYGWRIYGMISEESGQPQLISFESPQHTLAISQMYDEVAGEKEGPGRQAGQASDGRLR